MRSKNVKGAEGFTLIELLIVIGVLGILAGIILVAVDPAKRLEQARDARRFSEVNSMLNAILNYTVDNVGTLPTALDSVATNSQQLGTGVTCEVGCTGAFGGATVAACADLTSDLVDEYIAEIPVDPEGGNGTETYDAVRTGYWVNRSATGRIQVGSCNPERATAITVKR